jgi:uncharacterized BrkB/YihY/UPF0761 family membrane protein
MILVVGFLLLLTFVANTAIVYSTVHVGADVVTVMTPLLIGGLEQAISGVVGLIGFALIYTARCHHRVARRLAGGVAY